MYAASGILPSHGGYDGLVFESQTRYGSWPRWRFMAVAAIATLGTGR